MRYHAVVHDLENDNKTAFECHVIANDTGAAREAVKAHLRKNDQENLAKMNISLVEYREDIESDLLLIVVEKED